MRHSEGRSKTYEHANDAPEISRSQGTIDGIVVLWPRISPRTEDPATLELATRVQAKLERLAGQASKEVDRRPAPERVCPRQGCKGISLGAVLATKGKGCAVVAVVGPKGATPVRLVALAGTVTFTAEETAFREPPENAMIVNEFVPCEKLLKDLDANVVLEGEAKVSEALTKAR